MGKREPALPASARPPGRPDDPANLRRFAGEFPTGVAVVTALIFLRGQFFRGVEPPARETGQITRPSGHLK